MPALPLSAGLGNEKVQVSISTRYQVNHLSNDFLWWDNYLKKKLKQKLSHAALAFA